MRSAVDAVVAAWTIQRTGEGCDSCPVTNGATGLASMATRVENEHADDFNRLRFVRTMNNAIQDMAKSGMIDLPQHPGMAAVPIAVYRAARGGPEPLRPQESARPAGSGPISEADRGALIRGQLDSAGVLLVARHAGCG